MGSFLRMGRGLLESQTTTFSCTDSDQRSLGKTGVFQEKGSYPGWEWEVCEKGRVSWLRANRIHLHPEAGVREVGSVAPSTGWAAEGGVGGGGHKAELLYVSLHTCQGSWPIRVPADPRVGEQLKKMKAESTPSLP